LSGNADALTSLTGKSVEETKKWLEDMASAANALDPNAADGWDKLLGSLLQGLPGLADTEEGRQFLEGLTTSFLAMGTESEEGTAGLRALGLSTDEIEQKQATWLATCKELVRTIPGLSSIIDTNTGEIQGGIPSLKAYADERERTAKY
jgi:phytoene dehydrogenase-like protein